MLKPDDIINFDSVLPDGTLAVGTATVESIDPLGEMSIRIEGATTQIIYTDGVAGDPISLPSWTTKRDTELKNVKVAPVVDVIEVTTLK